MPLPSLSEWHFDLDHYLNPILPPAWAHRLPYPISIFLGHRKGPKPQLGNLIVIFWMFIGIFGALSLIVVVNKNIPIFQDHDAPVLIGSFGAAAVLEFYAIESPLAQPRNAILGQVISSIVGVAFARAFRITPRLNLSDGSVVDIHDEHRWLAVSLSCATATALMALTGTVHPPAGATALIAVIDDGAVALGWLLVPMVMLGCGLMMAVALLVNNVQRRFPIYWWTPEATGGWWKRKTQTTQRREREKGSPEVAVAVSVDEESAGEGETRLERVDSHQLLILKGEVFVPRDMFLRPEEKLLLESLSRRL